MGVPGFEQVPRYRELAYRVFGEDIDFLPPGIMLEQDRDEWALWKREILWIAYAVIAAGGAGFFGNAQLWNPPAAPGDPLGEQPPGSLCVLDAIMVRPTTATNALVRIQNAQISAAFASHAQRDSRVRTFNNVIFTKTGPSMRTANGTATPPGTVIWEDSMVAGTTKILSVPSFVITPGNGISVSANVANEIFTAGFIFRTRPMRPEELA